MGENGKGSKSRISNSKQYRDNYDEIFSKPKSYTEWSDKNINYFLYLEDFYLENGPGSDKIPLTEYEFNNIKDYEG